jgi:hypothetical protein
MNLRLLLFIFGAYFVEVPDCTFEYSFRKISGPKAQLFSRCHVTFNNVAEAGV